MDTCKKKFYEPKIEEFHHGFEYEFLYRDKWNRHNLDGTPIVHHELDQYEDDLMKLAHAICRVKFLDQEDIESFGFEFYEKSVHRLVMTGGKIKGETVYIEFKDLNQQVTIENYEDYEDNTVWFQGTIKNKSELKKILEMIGYKRNGVL